MPQIFYADRVCYRPVLRAERCPSGCVACVKACPVEALKPGIPPALSSERCILCSACKEACTHDAIRFVPDAALLKELSRS